MCIFSFSPPDITNPPPPPPPNPNKAAETALSGTDRRNRDRSYSPGMSLTIPSPLNIP